MAKKGIEKSVDIILLEGYERRVLNWSGVDQATDSVVGLVVNNYARHLLRMLVDDDTPTHVIESSLARVVAEYPFIIAKTPALRRVIARLEGRL